MNDNSLGELIERVEQYEFDEGSPSLPFVSRLARENGWSLKHADRVVHEYKRFAILAATAGHPVTPSEEVDQAWHLHLTYTRSYWERFCPLVLQMPLHHNPIQGGIAEHAKFFEWYAGTLASYQRIFGTKPPDDIWPHPTRRFARAGAGRWVDPGKYWLIPKLRLRMPRWKPSFFACFLLMTLASVSGCRPGGLHPLNPFDFTGPVFIVFYVSLTLLGIAISVWCRLSVPLGKSERQLIQGQLANDPYVVAALATGPRGVVFTALANLFFKKNLKVIEITEQSFFGLLRKKSQKLVRGKPLPADALEIERVLFAAADEEGCVETKEIIEAGLPIGEAYRDQLRDVDLVESDPPREIGYRIIAGVTMSIVFLVGLIKLGVGLARDKPVGILVSLLIATGILTGYFFLSNRYLTPNGRTLLKRLKKQNQDLNTSSTPTHLLGLHDVAMTTALFGAIMWRHHDGGLADLYAMLRSQNVFSGGGYPGGAGCGGGGCGGGGGGGGCGGCGGGG